MSVTLEQLQALATRLVQLEEKKDAEVAALAANLEKERGERVQEQVVLQASLEQERGEREKEKAAHDEEMKKVFDRIDENGNGGRDAANVVLKGFELTESGFHLA